MGLEDLIKDIPKTLVKDLTAFLTMLTLPWSGQSTTKFTSSKDLNTGSLTRTRSLQSAARILVPSPTGKASPTGSTQPSSTRMGNITDLMMISFTWMKMPIHPSRGNLASGGLDVILIVSDLQRLEAV